MIDWYRACAEAAQQIERDVPGCYRSRTFTGIIGDIKALSPRKACSLIARKKGLGNRYAYLYLTQGIDDGRGYQACASEALRLVLETKGAGLIGERVLDVGCAVGVTAGILGLHGVTGFDLFPDLLRASCLVDSLTGAVNRYVTADMTNDWPFRRAFDTVFCGLVCHHLKEQRDIFAFFTSAARTLAPGGALVITLPSGTIAHARQLRYIAEAIEGFGFRLDSRVSGLVISGDNPHSLFWMFTLVFIRTSDTPLPAPVFIHPEFGFPEYRTPVTREEKGLQAKSSVTRSRAVRHTEFILLQIDTLEKQFGDSPLVFATLSKVSEIETP